MTERQKQVAGYFARDTSGHKLTIVRDDGLYRHLKFRGPQGFDWFDLITWPGVLTIHGDHGTFVFSRITDMFEFFREKEINYYYWSQKCIAVDRPDGMEEFSEKAFVDAALRQMAYWLDLDDPEELPKKLAEKLRKEAGSWAEEGKDYAFRLAYDYEHEGGRPFAELWECRVDEHCHGYLWCLNAIKWGIEQYDAAKRGETQ